MATVRIPVQMLNPRVTSLAGNAFWTVAGLTTWDAGRWEFILDVEGRVYGLVAVPKNVAATPNSKLVLDIAANATTGVTRLTVATKAVADTESLNPTSLTAETAQDVTVPATAYLRKTVVFPATGNLAEAVAADDLLLVEITHNGNHANDTLAVNTLLMAAFLQVDI